MKEVREIRVLLADIIDVFSGIMAKEGAFEAENELYKAGIRRPILVSHANDYDRGSEIRKQVFSFKTFDKIRGMGTVPVVAPSALLALARAARETIVQLDDRVQKQAKANKLLNVEVQRLEKKVEALKSDIVVLKEGRPKRARSVLLPRVQKPVRPYIFE